MKIMQFSVKGRIIMLIMGNNKADLMPLKSQRRKPG
jgi:hypothetical protein